MKILMLGWEFPPYISGGLGTACYGLTKGMSQIGAQVLFVLPRPAVDQTRSHVQLLSPSDLQAMDPALAEKALADIAAAGIDLPGLSSEDLAADMPNVTIKTVDALLQPYTGQEQHACNVADLRAIQQAGQAVGRSAGQSTSQSAGKAAGEHQPAKFVDSPAPNAHYHGDLITEVRRYACLVANLAQQYTFDIIHAHDWMTYPAGIALAKATKKPLVVHIHSTEFDRSVQSVDQTVYDIERQGMHAAQRVIAVSHLTKGICTARYDIPPEKIEVVYNAILNGKQPINGHRTTIAKGEKIVLFLGRITYQKGPEYFLAAAKKVLSVMENVKFIMAGSGDMTRRTIELAAGMGIGHKVLFPGFLRGQDVEKVYRMADLYVMPSVSEPFGIAPLEAMSNDVPVIISKQSGVSELLTNVLSVDFWDIDEMANKIVAVLRHPPLQATLRQHGSFEVRKLSWQDSAQECIRVYQSVLSS